MKINRRSVLAPAALFSALGFLVSVGFNACSEVSFEADGAIDQQSLAIPDVPLIDSIVANCEILYAAGSLQVHNQTITFEDSKIETGRNEVCLFGQGENLSKVNGEVRAEYTQKANLRLPANAVLCGMSVSSKAQTVKYDDMFHLKFNDYIIASNHKSAVERIDPERIFVGNSDVYIYKYNWSSLVESPFGNQANDDFCLGESEGLSSCSWPKTEQTGNFSLNYDNELLINLGARKPANQQQLALTVTGDNDASLDCYHSKLSIDVQVKYYLK